MLGWRLGLLSSDKPLHLTSMYDSTYCRDDTCAPKPAKLYTRLYIFIYIIFTYTVIHVNQVHIPSELA